MGLAGFPATEDVWRRAVSIPIYPALTDPEVERVIDVIAAMRQSPLGVAS